MATIKPSKTSQVSPSADGMNLNGGEEQVIRKEAPTGPPVPLPINRKRDYRSSAGSLEFAKSTEEITYTWKDLNVWTEGSSNVDPEKGGEGCCKKKTQISKHLLKNVTGVVHPGELLAIMGASGAGKSTMLNVLNFRNTGKLKVTGERSVNGVAVGPDSLTSVSAYIQQDDLFIGLLTVREHLVFQARVRMHSHIPYKSRLERVEEVIQELGLSKCADTQIGHPGVVKGISGGEMKRLSFASEVLTDPPLLFCDEPTSGLDSYMSQNVVGVLKGLSARGKTILCTIHQPSSQLFQMFDRLLLMAEGRVAFMGKTSRALQFFKENGYPCPENYNPSDFYIQTLAIEPGREDEGRENVGKICDAYAASEESTTLEELATHTPSDLQVAAYLEREGRLKFKSPYKASWFAQFRAVLWRSFLTNMKNPMFIRLKFIVTAIQALIIGTVYFGQKFDQFGVQNVSGALFMALMNLSFGNAMSTVEVFCVELPIFLREHFNGMYRTDVYFLSKMFAEVPFYIFFPFLSVTIFYFMVGLQPTAEAFFITAAIYILITNVAISVGYLVSCFAPGISEALGVAPLFIVPMALFGGVLINSGSVPIYLIWLKSISWFYYGNEALTVVQWRHVRKIPCNGPTALCVPNGTYVLRSLDFKEENLGVDILALLGLVVGFRILAFLALLAKTYRKK